MDRDLQTSLLHDNPWIGDPEPLDDWLKSHLPDDYIPRELLSSAGARWVEPSRAHLVVGPRQAGKSTAIWAHLAGIGQPALFIDCEQRLVQDWCRSAPLFLTELAQVTSPPVPLFFEEAQHLENAGLFFKGIVDRNVGVPILVTGSSSLHLGAKIRESLAGRATRERLLPFSFAEVCQPADGLQGLARDRQRTTLLERHMVYGGYPDVWLSNEPRPLLMDLVESIILRDASDLFRIGRPDAFRRLLRLAAGQVGNLVNLAEWASVLGISRDTVASYLEILEAGHVVALVPPYAGGKRSELTRAHKVFFVDNGIRNHLVGSFTVPGERVDAGQTTENWAYGELTKTLPMGVAVHYWRSTSRAEVDFVIDAGSFLVGLEVKAGAMGRASIPRSSRSFIDAYQPRCFLMVSAGSHECQRIGHTEVRWITPDAVAPTVRGLVP